MCFHSPYAESWHLYTFPKLLSISKDINFCLDLCCNPELVLGCCRKLPRATVFFQRRDLSVVVAGEFPKTETWICRQRGGKDFC